MKTHHALRYLFLRYLTKERGRVSKEIYNEVSRSLSVLEREDGSFLLQWRRKAQDFQKIITAEEVDFYEKGDHASSTGAIGGIDRKNPKAALAWASEALGLPTRALNPSYGNLFPWWMFEVTGYLLLCAYLIARGGQPMWPFVTSVMIIFALEYWVGKGSLAIPFVLGGLGFFLPFTAIFGLVSYLVCFFLNPNPVHRTLRIYLCVFALFAPIAASLGGYAAHSSTEPRLVWSLLVTLGIGGLAFVVRWLRGAHLRALPLILPILAVGLWADHLQWIALELACISLVGSLFVSYGHFMFPIQNERSLTPNG